MIIETIMSRDSLANLRLLKGHRFEFLYEMGWRSLDNIDSLHIATDGPSIQVVSDDYNDQDAGSFEVRISDPNYRRKCLVAGWVFLQNRHQLIKNILVVRTTYKNRLDNEGNRFEHCCERGIVFELEDSSIYFQLDQPFSFLFGVKYLNSLEELEVPSRQDYFDEEPDINFEYQLVAVDDLLEEK